MVYFSTSFRGVAVVKKRIVISEKRQNTRCEISEGLDFPGSSPEIPQQPFPPDVGSGYQDSTLLNLYS